MTSDEEAYIEAYIRRPDTLDDPSRRRVRRLIENDAEARAWAGVLRSTYAAFDALSDDVPAVVDEFVDDLFAPPSVLSLVERLQGGPTVLAADAGPSSRFESLSVLTSTEHGVLVRILWDTRLDEGRVYLLARERTLYRHALFESVDASLQVPLREDGHGRFSGASQVSREALRHGRLRRCLWSGEVVAGETPSSALHIGAYTVMASWPEPSTLRLQVTVRDGDRASLQWAGLDDGVSLSLTAFRDDVAEVNVPPGETRCLRLFA